MEKQYFKGVKHMEELNNTFLKYRHLIVTTCIIIFLVIILVFLYPLARYHYEYPTDRNIVIKTDRFTGTVNTLLIKEKGKCPSFETLSFFFIILQLLFGNFSFLFLRQHLLRLNHPVYILS